MSVYRNNNGSETHKYHGMGGISRLARLVRHGVSISALRVGLRSEIEKGFLRCRKEEYIYIYIYIL